MTDTELDELLKSTERHTLGKWEFYENNQYGGTVNLGDTGVSIYIDRCHDFTGEMVIARDAMNANGFLVAAAPVLRDEVVRLRAQLKGMLDIYNNTGTPSDTK